MTDPATSSQASVQRRRWRWFLGLGGLLLVLGIAGVTIATLMQLTSVMVFGPLLLVSSIIQAGAAFFAEKGKESFLHFAAAGLEMVLGFLIMANPFERLISPIALVAIFLMVIGLVRLARSLATESRGRAWIVITGIVALLLGISVWIGWPTRTFWFVGLCIAIDFLCHGVSWSALALADRKRLQQPAS